MEPRLIAVEYILILLIIFISFSSWSTFFILVIILISLLFSGGVHEDLVLPGLAEQPPCRLHLPRSRLWPTRHPLGE